MNYPLISILSMPVLVFCVVQLLLVTRVCSLCKFFIINQLLRAKSTTITDDNRKVVTPTEITVGFIDHFPLLPLKFLIWSLRGLLAGELHCSTVNLWQCLIYASLGAVVSGVVALTLFDHQWHSEPAYIYRSLGIKQSCSILILQVPTRLLGNQYIFKSHYRMAYVVCLILVVSILLSICVLGLHSYLLKVCQNYQAATGTQSLNEPWQVFSCFSQLTSCSHTTMK